MESAEKKTNKCIKFHSVHPLNNFFLKTHISLKVYYHTAFIWLITPVNIQVMLAEFWKQSGMFKKACEGEQKRKMLLHLRIAIKILSYKRTVLNTKRNKSLKSPTMQDMSMQIQKPDRHIQDSGCKWDYLLLRSSAVMLQCVGERSSINTHPSFNAEHLNVDCEVSCRRTWPQSPINTIHNDMASQHKHYTEQSNHCSQRRVKTKLLRTNGTEICQKWLLCPHHTTDSISCNRGATSGQTSMFLLRLALLHWRRSAGSGQHVPDFGDTCGQLRRRTVSKSSWVGKQPFVVQHLLLK